MAGTPLPSGARMTCVPAQPGGPTAIVIPVPAAEPAVRHWRDRHDPSARQDMPAHITVLYPFLPDAKITTEVTGRLLRLFAGQSAFDIVLAGCARFPGLVLYLDPQPALPFRALTAAITAAWPETPSGRPPTRLRWTSPRSSRSPRRSRKRGCTRRTTPGGRLGYNFPWHAVVSSPACPSTKPPAPAL